MIDQQGRRLYAFVRPEQNADCYFLYVMRLNNQTVHRMDSPANLINSAHTMCDRMESDSGAHDPVIDVGIQFWHENPGLNEANAVLFTNLAATAYCPSVIPRN